MIIQNQMQKPEVIRSLYSDQFKILEAIIQLHLQEKTFEVDVTYGNGGFYKKGIPQPTNRFDIDDKLENITKACNSNNTELKAASVNSVILTLRFLLILENNEPVIHPWSCLEDFQGIGHRMN